MTAPHPTKRCDTCEFWARGDQWPESLDSDQPPDDQIGACRRNAPRPTVGDYEFEILKLLSLIAWNYADEHQKRQDFNNWEEAYCRQSAWPATAGADWCGEWQLKDRPDVADEGRYFP